MKRNLATRSRAVALAVVLAAGTAGCSVNSPFQTAETMQISDGAPLDLERASLRNLVIVSDADGGDGVMTGTVDNTTNEEITLTISVGESEVTERIPPWSVARLSEDEPLTLTGLTSGSGTMTTIQASTGGNDSSPVDVPVLPATGYYEDYAPEDYTPPPSPSPSEEEGEH